MASKKKHPVPRLLCAHTRANMFQTFRTFRTIASTPTNTAPGSVIFNKYAKQHTLVLGPGQHVSMNATSYITTHHQVSPYYAIMSVAAGSIVQVISDIWPLKSADNDKKQPALLFSKSIEAMGLSRPGIMVQPGDVIFIDAARECVPDHVAYRASSSKEIPHITLQPGETFTITIA